MLYVDRDPSHNLKNSDVLVNIYSKLVHLPTTKKKELTDLISGYGCLFSDVPTQTSIPRVVDLEDVK